MIEKNLDEALGKPRNLRQRMNGLFWLIMVFLFALFFVGSSTYYKMSQSVTLGQLQDWREETTKTWKATIAQMDRIEQRQIRSLTMLEAILADSVISKPKVK